MDESVREQPLSETQYLIMASLIKPAHGYAIMQNARQITDGSVVIGPGTMYGTLKKLLKKKLICQLQPKGQGERKITYHLTETGRHLLELEIKRIKMLAAIGERKIREMRNKHE
jgi:DNA-binding PadR family transcriptional regulator